MGEVGKVSAVYPERNTAKVILEDQDNKVSQEFYVIKRGEENPWFPKVGEHVVYIRTITNDTGFILGSY